MPLKFNGTTVTAVNLVKNGVVTPLTKVKFNGTEVFSGSTPPTTLYYWKKYNVDEVTRTWYTEDNYGTASATGLSEVNGGYGYILNPENGDCSVQGSYTIHAGDPDNEECWTSNGSTLTHYFLSGGVIYSESKGTTIHTDTTQEKGSYIGEVSDNDPNAYPTDGISGGYWYTFDRSE